MGWDTYVMINWDTCVRVNYKGSIILPLELT